MDILINHLDAILGLGAAGSFWAGTVSEYQHSNKEEWRIYREIGLSLYLATLGGFGYFWYCQHWGYILCGLLGTVGIVTFIHKLR